jgi:hypothetical protein
MNPPTNQYEQPLYDATKPIACTIQAAQIPDHLARIERMRVNMESIERTQHGIVLRLPSSEANAADLRQFAADEKACCEFWGFAVTEEHELALRWDGPPELGDYFDKLVAYFEGRAPVGSLLGGLSQDAPD